MTHFNEALASLSDEERLMLAEYIRLTTAPPDHIWCQGDGGTWMTMPRAQCSDEFLAQHDDHIAYLLQHLPVLDDTPEHTEPAEDCWCHKSQPSGSASERSES
jgi:hypothetical protein